MMNGIFNFLRFTNEKVSLFLLLFAVFLSIPNLLTFCGSPPKCAAQDPALCPAYAPCKENIGNPLPIFSVRWELMDTTPAFGIAIFALIDAVFWYAMSCIIIFTYEK